LQSAKTEHSAEHSALKKIWPSVSNQVGFLIHDNVQYNLAEDMTEAEFFAIGQGGTFG